MLLERAEGARVADHAAARADQGSALRRLSVATRPTDRPDRWAHRLRGRLLVTEALLSGAVAAVVLLGRPEPVPVAGVLFWAALSLVVVWPALLAVTGAYDERSFGIGTDEFRRVGRAGLLLPAALGSISSAAELTLSRALVVIAAPVLPAVPLREGYTARRSLHRERMRGR